jgi:hypothetical protein
MYGSEKKVQNSVLTEFRKHPNLGHAHTYLCICSSSGYMGGERTNPNYCLGQPYSTIVNYSWLYLLHVIYWHQTVSQIATFNRL